ncbi:hypothetical protein [Shewanella sp. SR44-4]|uniref:hypothetical protein n=1 Tax=Shewanella sp. SR44-4 TaxID=2760935 RepID=UPI002175E58F|nr:hypothetical protein [Shewanella sp. SR44-4]
MMILKRKFDTKFGVVTLSDSFYKLGCKLKQTEITYKPHDYNGWGITRTVNAIEVEDFTQADAEFFAEVAESKLRVNRPSESFVPYDGTKLNQYEMGGI